MNEDPKNRALFRKLEASWNRRPDDPSDMFDLHRGLDKLRTRIREEENPDTAPGRYGGMPPVSGESMRAGNLHRLQRARSRFVPLMAAAGILFLVIAASIFVTLQLWEEAEPQIYTTSDVEQRIITLSDGSVVRLNRNSLLEVPADFRENSGTIRLRGEAFFDVVHDPSRPFEVHVDEAIVRVLGTSFSVKRGEEVLVAVREGAVSLRHSELEERSAVTLRSGHLGVLSSDGRQVSIEQTEIENYLSWMNGYLRFESMPFDQVVQQLERIYGIGYELEDPTICELLLTVYTERMEKEEVVETIALALDLEYRIIEDGNRVVWMR